MLIIISFVCRIDTANCLSFYFGNQQTTMAISPTDRFANHGGAEYRYISKLDIFMRGYAEF